MKTVYLSYYKNFKCIAENCPDTCCAGWKVCIDDNSLNRYLSTTNKFGKRLKENIVYEDESHCFKLVKNRCAFLNDKNLCDIYSVLGKDALTKVCSSHPRFIENYGLINELTLSLSCPEACRLMLEETDGLYFLSEDNDEPLEPNDIDPKVFIFLKKARQIVFELITDKNADFLTRLSTIFDFCLKIQRSIRNKNYTLPTIDFVKPKLNKQKIDNVLNAFNGLEYSRNIIQDFLLKNKSTELLSFTEFIKNFSDIYIFENLLTVYVYRYFLTAVYDKKLMQKVRLITSSLIFIMLSLNTLKLENKLDSENIIKIISNFSREIFHNDENIKKITDKLKNNKII